MQNLRNMNEQQIQMLAYMTSLPPSQNTYLTWLQAHSPKIKFFESNEKTGKWCINLPKEEIDEAWLKIKEACRKNKFILAKCSTSRTSGTAQYPLFLICVYTNDWENTEDVQKVRQTLKDIGFTQPLKYKRDIETINNVYGTDDEFFIVE